MKKFTRLLFTLVLLCAVGVNVVSAQTEQVALTKDMFYTWNGFGASASSTGPANVEFNLGKDLGGGNVVCGTGTVDYLMYADISGSFKIIFEGTKGLPLRLLINRQESNNGPLVEKQVTLDENGKGEIDLKDQAYVHINAIKVNWGGSGQVTSIKIEKPADPVELAKGVIKKTISAAKTVDGSIYTTESYNKLKTALAAAEAALSASSVETIEAANAALNTAIDALVYKIGMSDLTKDLFINHDNNQPAGCSYVLNSPTGLPYGDGNVFWKNYADLSEYSKLIVTVSAGVPRFCFNRTEDQAQYSGDPKNPKFFSIPNDAFATEAYQKVSGNVYTIDIAKIVADYGFAYLHCIKGPNFQSTVTVTGMYLLKVVEGAKDEEDVSGALAELRQAIAQAETVNTESASEYRQGVFSKTLSEAQILVAIAEAGDATVGWIRTMMARIDNAVNMLYVEDPEVIPYEYTPKPVTYKGVKKDLKAAVDAAEATLDANQNKPEALQNALATLIDQGNTILANDYSKMDQEEFEEMVNTVINRIKAAEEALLNYEEDLSQYSTVKSVLEPGIYYMYNVAAKRYLVGANNWGTRASVGEGGIAITVEKNNGKYLLKTSPLYTNCSIGHNGYVDNGEGNTWIVEGVNGKEDVYTLNTGSAYLFWDGGSATTTTVGNISATDEKAQWQFMTKAQIEETFADATVENPIDATFYIINPNFSRNTGGRGWTMEAGNKNLSGGANENMCAESWRSSFTLTQNLTVADGKYMLKAQAALTDYAGLWDGADYPVVYVNELSVPFNNMTEGENSMDWMSGQFSAGKYEIEPIYFDVVGGNLTIGVRGTRSDTWCIWDNFRLYYLGASTEEGQAAIAATKLNNALKAYNNAVSQANVQKGKSTDAEKAVIDDILNETSGVDMTDPDALKQAAADINTIVSIVSGLETAKSEAETAKASAPEALKNQIDDALAQADAATTPAEMGKAAVALRSLTELAGGITIADNSIDGWTCTNTNTFHINTWSGEGNSDGSEMKTPFIENWVGKPGPLGNGAVYYTQKGLTPGFYEATALVRFYSESGKEPAGGYFFAEGGSSQEIATAGTPFEFNGMKGFFGNYSAAVEVGEDGTMEFGVGIYGATFNWVAIKNVKITPIEETRYNELMEGGTPWDQYASKIANQKNWKQAMDELNVYLNTGRGASKGNPAVVSAMSVFNNNANTKGRDEFEAVINKAKSVLWNVSATPTDCMNMIEELTAAQSHFELINIPVSYYLKNVATGKWWGSGNAWGTRASLLEHPEFVKLNEAPDGTYTMETQVSNGDGQIYLGFDGNGQPFMDQATAIALTLKKSNGKYTILSDNGYFGWNGEDTNIAANLEDNDPNAVWEVYTDKQMKAALLNASVGNPVDATWLILDPNFGRNHRYSSAWTMDAGNKNLCGGADDNRCAESWRSSFTLSQDLSDIPNGLYALNVQAALTDYTNAYDGANYPVAYANNETSKFIDMEADDRGTSMTKLSGSFSAGRYNVETIYVEVTDGQMKIGVKGTRTDTWCIWDNFSLTYYGEGADIEAVKNSSVFVDLAKLIEQGKELLDEVEVEKVKTALTKAIEVGEAAHSLDDANAALATLKEAVAAAEGSVKAKDVLPKMKELVEMNNIATAEALEEYYGQWVTKYQEGTITKAEASALQDPTVLTGWHASLTCDDYLLSAWDAEPDFQSPYYINTWSVEGDKDGTNFHVPFIEYWTGDDSSLGEKTMTAAIDGVPAGKYTVEAWVRVRMKNSGSAPTYGISMQANGSNPVDVCDGEESTDGSSTFFNKVYQIPVTIGADGALTVSFDIASDNNVSWLAIKNVRYFDPNATGIKTVGTQKAAGQIFNLQGQRVNKATKGVFIQDGKIILKK